MPLRSDRGHVAKHQDHKRRRSPPKCSAVNWSEVAQKVTAHSADWELGSSLLLSFGLWIWPDPDL